MNCRLPMPIAICSCPNGITPAAMRGGYHALIGRSVTDIRVSLTPRRVWLLIKDVKGAIAHLQKVDVASENTRVCLFG